MSRLQLGNCRGEMFHQRYGRPIAFGLVDESRFRPDMLRRDMLPNGREEHFAPLPETRLVFGRSGPTWLVTSCSLFINAKSMSRLSKRFFRRVRESAQ